MFCVILVGCGHQNNPVPIVLSETPEQPVITTLSQVQTSTPQPILTPTVTLIPPYPTKQLLLDYKAFGSHSAFDMYYVDYGFSKLVLYSDGQLIIPGKVYKQKILSEDEINQFFSKLETLGFFSLTQDNLYDFGNQEPPKVFDGTTYCVSAFGERELEVCAYKPHESFLVPKMKNVLQFLNEFQSENMTPYDPDRILLWVQPGRNQDISDLPKESIPWKDSFPSLVVSDLQIAYAEGDIAKEIFALFDNEITFKVFTQDGIEYTVLVEIVLPHEEITNLYEQ